MIFAFFFNIDAGLLEYTLEPFLGNYFGVTLLQLSQIFAAFIFSGAIGGMHLRFLLRKKLDKVKLLIFISYYMSCMASILCISILTSTITLQLYILVNIRTIIVASMANMVLFAFFVEMSDKKLAATSFIFLFFLFNSGYLLGILFSGFFHIGIIYLISAIIMASRTILLFMLLKMKKSK